MSVTPNVQNIADLMGNLEAMARDSVRAARQSRPDFKAIADGSPVPMLMASKYHAELVATVTSYGAALLDLHHRMTADAQLYGVDIPALPPDSGAGEGEIGLLGGGDR